MLSNLPRREPQVAFLFDGALQMYCYALTVAIMMLLRITLAFANTILAMRMRPAPPLRLD